MRQIRKLTEQHINGEIGYHTERIRSVSRQQQGHHRQRIQQLNRKLQRRTAELGMEESVRAAPPTVHTAALVIPQGLLDTLDGTTPEPHPDGRDHDRVATAAAAVEALETALGRSVSPAEEAEQGHGYHLRVQYGQSDVRYVKLLCLARDATSYALTRSEVLHAKNLGPGFRLALVAPPSAGSDDPGVVVRYLDGALDPVALGDFEQTLFWRDARTDWTDAAEPWSPGPNTAKGAVNEPLPTCSRGREHEGLNCGDEFGGPTRAGTDLA